MNIKIQTVLICLCLVVPVLGQAQELGKYQPVPTQGRVKVPETPTAYMKLAALYYTQKNYDQFLKVMQKLAEMRPQDPDIQFRLGTAYALKNDKKNAFNTLMELSKLGVSYDISGEDFDYIKGFGLYDYIADAFKKNAEPTGDYDPVVQLQTDQSARWIIDGSAWDANSNRLILGSVNLGRVFSADLETGKVKTLIKADKKNGLQSVFGLAVDLKNDRLWLTSNPTNRFQNEAGITRPALFEFSLKKGRFIKRYELQEDERRHHFGQLTVDQDGDVFFVDALTRTVFTKQADQSEIQALVHLPKMERISGIAVMPDTAYLYIADADSTIYQLNRDNQEVRSLALKAPLVMTGIEGIYARSGQLIAIQSNLSPQRIMRYDLSEDGLKVEGIKTLLSGTPELKKPTTAVIKGEHLVFAANSHWVDQDPIQIARVVIGQARQPEIELKP